MSVGEIKKIVAFAKEKFEIDFLDYVKPMSDYSLALAQTVKADPLVCMITSLLHRFAEGITGDFRANKVNHVLREFGFESNTIDKINDAINRMLPETKNKQYSLEDKVVADAYILTYWRNFTNYDKISFNYEESERIFHSIEN